MIRFSRAGRWIVKSFISSSVRIALPCEVSWPKRLVIMSAALRRTEMCIRDRQDAALEPPRERGKLAPGVELEAVQEVLDPDFALPVLLAMAGLPEPGGHHRVDVSVDIRRNLLRQTSIKRTRRPKDIAGVRLHLACDDAHERGFASPVATHQADTLSRINLEIDVL